MQVYPMCAQIEQHILSMGLEKDLENSVRNIFRDRWNKMHSPLHSAAYMLEPQFRNTAFDPQVTHCHMLVLACILHFRGGSLQVSMRLVTILYCRSKQTSRQ